MLTPVQRSPFLRAVTSRADTKVCKVFGDDGRHKVLDKIGTASPVDWITLARTAVPCRAVVSLVLQAGR